jgi:tetratricopeptide (TPR) repeat protein
MKPSGHRLHLKARRAGGLLVLVGALLTSAPGRLHGHDSPEHVIESLTARLEAEPTRADLYWRRATEHRVLGQLKEAERDLRKALKLNPSYLAALTDLSRVQLARGSRRAALRSIDRALSQAESEEQRAPLRMVKADIYADGGQYQKALAECERALPHASGLESEWYLTRSQLQFRLGHFLDAATGLREGFERTGSGVLEAAWIEALIDGGSFDEAAAKISAVLEDCRWRSTWLIRRARVRLGLGDVSAAHGDLLAAINELNERLTAPHPSPELLADRALAYALAGDTLLARQDLSRARSLGAEQSTLHRVQVALAKNHL